MDHTYLFEAGTWDLAGTVTGRARRSDLGGGRVRIEHGADAWSVEARLEFRAGDEAAEVVNRYQVVPCAAGGLSTPWTAVNSFLGDYAGQFVVVGETIFSAFGNAEGSFSGVESMRRLDDGTYENRGVLFEGKEVSSTWSITLTRRGG